MHRVARFFGRASRSEFWWCVRFLVGSPLLLPGLASHKIAALFALATFVPYRAAGSRRPRDDGHSPWRRLIGVVRASARRRAG